MIKVTYVFKKEDEHEIELDGVININEVSAIHETIWKNVLNVFVKETVFKVRDSDTIRQYCETNFIEGHTFFDKYQEYKKESELTPTDYYKVWINENKIIGWFNYTDDDADKMNVYIVSERYRLNVYEI